MKFHTLITALLIFIFCLPCHGAEAELKDEAKLLYETYQHSIFQIRVIELASGNKTAIGSGFLVDPRGYIATNFHVVSNKVHNPERYRLEYVSSDGRSGDLQLVDIDVVHDLAITRTQYQLTSVPAIQLSSGKLSKGTKIFSLGNPHDLGLSVVEGTYNGLLEKSLYDKIFFSGSLNPGMSGGPTLNRKGDVIGINVSTAGNQVSFLVPVKYLAALLTQALNGSAEAAEKFDQRIEQQLVDNQSRYLRQLIDAPWQSTRFGAFQLPGVIAELFKCWGDSDNSEDALIDHAYINCFSEDRIYLAPHFSTGGIAYTYELYTNKELSSLHFYHIYDAEFGRPVRLNSANKEDVSNYQCHTDFTQVDAKNWKTALCARHYRDYPSLYDISLLMALVSENYSGLIIQIALTGVSKDLGLKFVERFIKEVAWQK